MIYELSEIESKLAQCDDELFAELSLSYGKGAILKDPIKSGKELFKKILTRIQNDICHSQKIHDLYTKQADATLLVASILDAIGGVISNTPVPVTTVGVLVFRTGLPNICSGFWDEK